MTGPSGLTLCRSIISPSLHGNQPIYGYIERSHHNKRCFLFYQTQPSGPACPSVTYQHLCRVQRTHQGQQKPSGETLASLASTSTTHQGSSLQQGIKTHHHLIIHTWNLTLRNLQKSPKATSSPGHVANPLEIEEALEHYTSSNILKPPLKKSTRCGNHCLFHY